MTLKFEEKEVQLITLVTEGRDAEISVYMAPKDWTKKNNLEQFDWGDISEMPTEILKEVMSFPKLEKDLLRLWVS